MPPECKKMSVPGYKHCLAPPLILHDQHDWPRPMTFFSRCTASASPDLFKRSHSMIKAKSRQTQNALCIKMNQLKIHYGLATSQKKEKNLCRSSSFFFLSCSRAWRVPDVLCGVPPLRWQLTALWVVHWWMKDGDAHIPVLGTWDSKQACSDKQSPLRSAKRFKY